MNATQLDRIREEMQRKAESTATEIAIFAAKLTDPQGNAAYQMGWSAGIFTAAAEQRVARWVVAVIDEMRGLGETDDTIFETLKLVLRTEAMRGASSKPGSLARTV